MAFDPRYLNYVNPAATQAGSNADLQRLQQAYGGRSLEEIKKSIEQQRDQYRSEADSGDMAGSMGANQRLAELQKQLDMLGKSGEIASAEVERQKQAENLQARAEGTATAAQSPAIAQAEKNAAMSLAQATTLARMKRSATGAAGLRGMQQAKAEQSQIGAQTKKVTQLQDMLAVRQQLGREAFAQEGANMQAQLQADLQAAQDQQRMMGAMASLGGALIGRGMQSSESPFGTQIGNDLYADKSLFNGNVDTQRAFGSYLSRGGRYGV